MRALAIGAIALVACGSPTPPPAPTPEPAPTLAPTSAPTPAPKPTPTPTPAPTMPDAIRWIGFGGVEGPSSNQLSIEDELIAVQTRLGPTGGVMLYAGGPNTSGVQVTDTQARNTGLIDTLADLFDPRLGRDAHYAPLRLVPHDAGTHANLEAALKSALAEPAAPRLLLWIAGHGGPGETALDVTLADWLGEGLTVSNLSSAFNGLRPLRLFQTTCFGGGFAEAVLAHPTRACGMFATTWDLEASGCDPDPERARDSYGALLLKALADPQLTPANAHVRAAIDAPGIEVPILSSQAWLERAIGDDFGTPDPEEPLLSEERTLLRELTTKLGITATDLPALFDRLADEEVALATTLDAADLTVADAAFDTRAALIARWPVLDDPWHPDFQATLTTAPIAAYLEALPAYRAYVTAQADATTLHVAFDAHKAKIAPYDRALIALRTMQRAATAKRGIEGSTWLTFEALRRCEREALP